MGKPDKQYLPADEGDARGLVQRMARIKGSDMVPFNWPARPIVDLCMLVVALETRLAEVERRLEDLT